MSFALVPDVGLQVNPVALVVQILETFQVHGEVAVDGSTGFALVRDGTDADITLIPAYQVNLPVGLGGIDNQLRTTLRTYAQVGVTWLSSASGFGCSNLLLIK